MMHIIIPHVIRDVNKWPFINNSLGIIITDDNIDYDFQGSPCSENCVLVARAATFQTHHAQWTEFLNDANDSIVIWNHFGGSDSGNYKSSEIFERWENARFSQIPRVKGIFPIPYSMSASKPTPWDREIGKLSADLSAGNESAQIQNLAGLAKRLDKLANYAKAYYSAVGPLAILEVIKLAFPVILLLRKYEGQHSLSESINSILEMQLEDNSRVNSLKVLLADWTDDAWSKSGVDQKEYRGAVAFAKGFVELLESQNFTNSEKNKDIDRWFFSVSELWDSYVQHRWFTVFSELS